MGASMESAVCDITAAELSEITGLSTADAGWYLSVYCVQGPGSCITVAELYVQLCTQRCVDCDEVIQQHSNANWRKEEHQARCKECAKAMQREGYKKRYSYYDI